MYAQELFWSNMYACFTSEAGSESQMIRRNKSLQFLLTIRYQLINIQTAEILLVFYNSFQAQNNLQ
jgi:hypothetical protein